MLLKLLETDSHKFRSKLKHQVGYIRVAKQVVLNLAEELVWLHLFKNWATRINFDP